MAAYSIAHLDEIEEIDDGRAPFRTIRHHFGISSFGVNSFTGKSAGDRIINQHDETDDKSEELYIVLEGRARFELDGETVDAPAGTLVFAEPGVKRTAFAEQDGTTVLAVGGRPGEAYRVDGWEFWMPFQSLYSEGSYAEAADAALPVIDANPTAYGAMYNLACCEALAGRSEQAVDHLRRVIEHSERLREFAKSDTDLDSIRDDPAIAALLAG